MTRLFLSAIAAMLNTMITLPLDTISSRIVTDKSSHHDDDDEEGESSSTYSLSTKQRMDSVFDQLELLEGDTFYPARSKSFEEDVDHSKLNELYNKWNIKLPNRTTGSQKPSECDLMEYKEELCERNER